MSEEQRVRRCAELSLRPGERTSFDFVAMLGGGNGVRREPLWIASAAHLDAAVELDPETAQALLRIEPTTWIAVADAAARIGEQPLAALMAAGLIVREGDDRPAALADQRLREVPWHGPAAVAHRHSRWSGVDSVASQAESTIRSTDDLIAAFGPPPPHAHRRADAEQREPLPSPAANALDPLLARRATCRNFDRAAALPVAKLAELLHRVFGAHGRLELAPDAIALKKNFPSGGGLHPLEAYLLIQRVDGLVPGLYHYDAIGHVLERLRAAPEEDVRALALDAVAGQDYFAEAPVLLVIAARFARSFWKYRDHPKIYRAIVLEAGHASQTLYLSATAQGLGAYVTAAINEVGIEQAFGLDPMQEGVLAVCGFGARGTTQATVELDPQRAIWDEHGRLR